MLALLLAPGARAAPVPQVFQIRSEIEPERPLQPGEFTWSPGEAKGELVVVADLKTQMVHVYRGGEEIGVSTISTGRKGFERSEEHTSELQSLMRSSYAVFCLNKQNQLTPLVNTRASTS